MVDTSRYRMERVFVEIFKFHFIKTTVIEQIETAKHYLDSSL
jgi:hypothetical protein